MESVLGGMDGVVVFLDDILITGKNKEKHLQRLRLVLETLRNSGFKISLDKCEFFQSRVNYPGYVIDKEGLHTNASKVLAIKQAPRPTNVTSLKSFLGTVNYFAKFVKNIATVLYPLYRLLKKDVKWNWDDNCEAAYVKIKSLLISSEVLVHFDPNLELKLTVDASAYGVGAILSHVVAPGIEKPVAYASQTLTRSEQNYSQIEKEALAIIFGVFKFNQYLFAKKFTLVTDHMPLVAIFGHKRQIPQFSANRLPLENEENEKKGLEDVEINYSLFFAEIRDINVNFKLIQAETMKDLVLQRVIDLVKNGWPKQCSDVLVKPYYTKRFEYNISDQCLFWNHRIVIPEELRIDVLNQLHESHQGVVKMKALARAYFWWSGLDKNIEELANRCVCCSSLDAYSKWLEVFITSSTSSRVTIRALRNTFARYGLPRVLVLDNALGFVSEEFKSFLMKNGIHQITSPPYLPSSNGAAENSVKTVKLALKKKFHENLPADTETILCRFLLDYRNTPHSTTGVTPDKLMFGRNLINRFDLLLPNIRQSDIKNDNLDRRIESEQARQKYHYNGKKEVNFINGEEVYVKDYRDRNQKLNKIWKRHAKQIKKRFPEIVYPIKIPDSEASTHESNSDTNSITTQESPKCNASVSLPVNTRMLRKVIKPPDRLVYT
ncbi:uncharacterized protein K02A2.6-like [Coccinella septempunctata]|uniref:uncharacterized protein K02A2.6-like n=1 Tax=Coccinella septempunctata TaxID=41139 RepID=UPI001D068F71|nr:uncharacterized protein K02A2.6-like [Coccinella septempunctata]